MIWIIQKQTFLAGQQTAPRSAQIRFMIDLTDRELKKYFPRDLISPSYRESEWSRF